MSAVRIVFRAIHCADGFHAEQVVRRDVKGSSEPHERRDAWKHLTAFQAAIHFRCDSDVLGDVCLRSAGSPTGFPRVIADSNCQRSGRRFSH
jgi:hypothetical protein